MSGNETEIENQTSAALSTTVREKEKDVDAPKQVRRVQMEKIRNLVV